MTHYNMIPAILGACLILTLACIVFVQLADLAARIRDENILRTHESEQKKGLDETTNPNSVFYEEVEW
jgi:hypothetical protein